MVHRKALICILMAIAMTFASIASAWAISVNAGRGFPQPKVVAAQETAMPDCHRMAHKSKADLPASKTDVPDGEGKSCADNFCMAKCFKLFGSCQPDEAAVTLAAMPPLLPPSLPPIWFDQPPFAPPRS